MNYKRSGPNATDRLDKMASKTFTAAVVYHMSSYDLILRLKLESFFEPVKLMVCIRMSFS
jgi:hypothetical protein